MDRFDASHAQSHSPSKRRLVTRSFDPRKMPRHRRVSVPAHQFRSTNPSLYINLLLIPTTQSTLPRLSINHYSKSHIYNGPRSFNTLRFRCSCRLGCFSWCQEADWFRVCPLSISLCYRLFILNFTISSHTSSHRRVEKDYQAATR